MRKICTLILILTLILTALTSCAKKHGSSNDGFCVGACRSELYADLLKGKKVALFSNQSGLVGEDYSKHTLDFLLEKGINVTAIFSPEHGFRGMSDAGEAVSGSTDEQTGIRIYSLYDTKIKHPSEEMLSNVDVVVFDIQDVGTRFYTYYISMICMMESCADFGKSFVVFDRPNPNGAIIDGPVLDMENFRSWVGRIPVPMSHGLTMGEIALMADGEGWLDNDEKGKPRKLGDRLTVIPCRAYSHKMKYKLPKAPSPNLPTMKSIHLYPSLCLFEGTVCSVGRGTDAPFEIYGHPDFRQKEFSFTPLSNSASKNPPLRGTECFGKNLSDVPDSEIISNGINIEYIIDAFNNVKESLDQPDDFFPLFRGVCFFDCLAGTDSIRKMILEGKTASEIKKSWLPELEAYKNLRRKYQLYED